MTGSVAGRCACLDRASPCSYGLGSAAALLAWSRGEESKGTRTAPASVSLATALLTAAAMLVSMPGVTHPARCHLSDGRTPKDSAAMTVPALS